MKTGDRVVCVKTHSQSGRNGVVKGKEFIIIATEQFGCGCLSVDVGITIKSEALIKRITCERCGTGKHVENGDVWWLRTSLFAPIVEDREYISSDEFNYTEETIDLPITIEQ